MRISFGGSGGLANRPQINSGAHSMSKRADSSNARCARKVMFGIILAGSVIPIAARAGTAFTWDPAGASPSLGEPAFTADAIQGEHFYGFFPGPKVTP
jgi:hypothetical protein